MKFYYILLLLSAAAITYVSAFVQPTAFTRSTRLNSEEGGGDDIGGSGYLSIGAIPAEASDDVITVVSNEQMFLGLDSIRVQGDTLRTCSMDEAVERVEVLMKTGGRPLHANVELWQGHCNDPQRMKVYLEDGDERTFRAVFECPGSSNSISIRNMAPAEYPLNAGLEADFGGVGSSGSPSEMLMSMSQPRRVQGGAVYTLPFSPAVQSIQVCLSTDGRPMNAKIELLQGPNNVKQSMELYCESGDIRPFYTIFDSPGTGNQIRIVNTATIEYPLEAYIEPYIVSEDDPNAASMNWK